MSHFCGLVVLTPEYGEYHDLEDSIEKYDEALEVPEYSNGEVSDFDKVRFIDFYLKENGVKLKNVKAMLYSELLKEKKIKRWSSKKDGSKERFLHSLIWSHCERYGELFKEVHQKYFNSFESLYDKYGDDWNGNSWRVNPETGKWEEYSTRNPNSKWDWYDLNGRWSKSIKTKKGGFVNKCLLGDIDWTDFKPEDYEEEEKTNIWGKKYRPFKKNVKWHFTENNVPYSLVIDGNWYSQGDMGWFGYSDDKMTEQEWSKKFMELLKDLPINSQCYNIDYHI